MGAPREGRTCAKGVGRGERGKGKSVPSPGPQQAKEAREGRGQGVCRIRAHRWEAPAAEGAAANPPTLVRQPDRGATHKKGRQKQGAGACYGSRLSTRYARRAAQMKETRGCHDQSKKHNSNHTHSVERHRDTRAQLERHDGRVLKKEMKKERRTATTVDPRRANDTGRGGRAKVTASPHHPPATVKQKRHPGSGNPTARQPTHVAAPQAATAPSPTHSSPRGRPHHPHPLPHRSADVASLAG